MNPLDQLLRDAMTEHTESVPHLRPGSARRALVTSRRRQRLTMAAAGTATVAATAGVGAFAIHLQPTTSVSAGVGGPGGHGATAKDPVAVKSGAPTTAPAAAKAKGTVSRSASPISAPPGGGTSFVNGSAADAPAELRNVTLTQAPPGLSIEHQPGGGAGSDTYLVSTTNGQWSKWYWYSPAGAPYASGNVTITEGTSRPLWNQGQSPSPAVAPTTVNQRPGTVWLSGGDREIYYTAGSVTVEVFASDPKITLEQMKALGDAVQGLPQ